MRKLLFLLMTVAIMFAVACAESDMAAQTPRPAETLGSASAPTVAEEPIRSAAPVTEKPEFDEDADVSGADGYVSSQIEAAEQCRVRTGEAEYFFDTKKHISFDYELEFPLCRKDNESAWVDYLGTTGFSFQLCGRFIYIKSDVLQEDWPVGEMTRVINLDNGVIKPFGRNVDILVPKVGDYVYYTVDGDTCIYQAKSSLENSTEIRIHIPEQEEIESQFGEMDGLCKDISITKVEDGWIYFSFDVFEYEGPGIYEGNYRIRIDGSQLQKTDAGKFLTGDE